MTSMHSGNVRDTLAAARLREGGGEARFKQAPTTPESIAPRLEDSLTTSGLHEVGSPFQTGPTIRVAGLREGHAAATAIAQ